MFASELLSLLKKTNFSNHFAGIFSSDTIPKTLKNRDFIIVNRDASHEKGSHWYAVVRLNNEIEVFDSLGITDPSFKHFLQSTLNFNGITRINCNTTALQSVSSTYCGSFTLFYLWERYHNFDLSFTDLINTILTSDVNKNHDIVINSMRDYYGIT